MKVCVVGLWHLGTVTAACLAAAGHRVTGLDFDEAAIASLRTGRPPLFEPGLEQLVHQGLESGLLGFSTDPETAVSGADVIWIAYDTPVDDQDHADVEYVLARVKRLFPFLSQGQEVLLSSQLPVGTTEKLAVEYTAGHPGVDVSFSYSPENLRLGKAIAAFRQPGRTVVGTRTERSRHVLASLLAPFTAHIEWMSVESAEMTKHALNAFLATSISFINEIAELCEQVGADAREVERGLKTEPRIGPGAYLGPGGAFAGGTLARDIDFLEDLGRQHNLALPLVRGVRLSNDEHKNWPRRRLQQLLQQIRGRTIAVWGLTYKPGTDTLRRSGAIELCQWLLGQGAQVRAHDPSIKKLPEEYADIRLCASPQEAARGADALVVATEWPEYRDSLTAETVSVMRSPIILDANRFLAASVPLLTGVVYAAVGAPVKA